MRREDVSDRMPQAVRRVRPFWRRRRTTARPPRVRMRARKPCLRFLRRVLGWYVRFMLVSGFAPYGARRVADVTRDGRVIGCTDVAQPLRTQTGWVVLPGADPALRSRGGAWIAAASATGCGCLPQV